jgi:hypothetical protein
LKKEVFLITQIAATNIMWALGITKVLLSVFLSEELGGGKLSIPQQCSLILNGNKMKEVTDMIGLYLIKTISNWSTILSIIEKLAINNIYCRILLLIVK